MRRLLLLILFLFLPLISAACDSGQIDINSASLAELDNLSGIGPTKAQAIVDSRPFYSVDDLIRVSGIGNVTLNNIKTQNLACVNEEYESQAPQTEETKEEVVVEANQEVNVEEGTNVANNVKPQVTITEPVQRQKNSTKNSVINLNPQDIKTESSSAELNEESYALYGLASFSALLAVLFFIKNRKYKTEFT